MADLMAWAQLNLSDFAAGVATSVATAFIGWIALAAYRLWTNSTQIRMVGAWGEVPKKSGGNYAIGEITYDYVKMHYNYIGTCISPDGKKYSKWDTIRTYYSREERRLYYIFKGELFDDPGSDHFGFGVISLSKSGNKYVPFAGYFIAPKVDEELRNHSMVRLPFKYSADLDCQIVLQFLKNSPP